LEIEGLTTYILIVTFIYLSCNRCWFAWKWP